jgi:WD40 repeat protein
MKTKTVVIAVGLLIFSCVSAHSISLDKVTDLNDHKETINYIAFSRDGKQMASCSEDNMVYIWDTTNWKHTGTLRSEDEPLGVAFAPDGKHVFVIDHDSRLSRWDIDSGVRQTNDKIGCAVNDIKISPDGKTLAIACDAKKIVIWDVAENKLNKKLAGHKNDVMSLSFSADGRKLISGGKDCQAIVWDTSDWKELQVLKGHDEDILGAVLSPSGEQAASGSNDNKISLWDLKTGQRRLEFAKHDQEGDRAIAWHPSGKFLLAADRTPKKKAGEVDICETIAIEVASGAIRAAIPVKCGVNHLGITSDGGTVAVGGGNIAIYTVRE